MYTPALERLLVVQVESFPQYSEKMQSACCKSILKVLVAMASKGPVMWGFISSVGTLAAWPPSSQAPEAHNMTRSLFSFWF